MRLLYDKETEIAHTTECGALRRRRRNGAWVVEHDNSTVPSDHRTCGLCRVTLQSLIRRQTVESAAVV